MVGHRHGHGRRSNLHPEAVRVEGGGEQVDQRAPINAVGTVRKQFPRLHGVVGHVTVREQEAKQRVDVARGQHPARGHRPL